MKWRSVQVACCALYGSSDREGAVVIDWAWLRMMLRMMEDGTL